MRDKLLFFATSRLAVLAVNFFSTLLMTRYAAPDEFGYFSIAILAASFLIPITSVGGRQTFNYLCANNAYSSTFLSTGVFLQASFRVLAYLVCLVIVLISGLDGFEFRIVAISLLLIPLANIEIIDEFFTVKPRR